MGLPVSALDDVLDCRRRIGGGTGGLGRKGSVGRGRGRKREVVAKRSATRRRRRRRRLSGNGNRPGASGGERSFRIDAATRRIAARGGVGTGKGIGQSGLGGSVSALDGVLGRGVGRDGATGHDGSSAGIDGGRGNGSRLARSIGDYRGRTAGIGVANFSRSESSSARVFGIAGFFEIYDAVSTPSGIDVVAFAILENVRDVELEAEVSAVGHVRDARSERSREIRTVQSSAGGRSLGTADSVRNLRYRGSTVGRNEIGKIQVRESVVPNDEVLSGGRSVRRGLHPSVGDGRLVSPNVDVDAGGRRNVGFSRSVVPIPKMALEVSVKIDVPRSAVTTGVRRGNVRHDERRSGDGKKSEGRCKREKDLILRSHEAES